MERYEFGKEDGRPVTLFNSKGASVFPVAELANGATINRIDLGPGGVLGDHPAAAAQLFLVIEGSGWVRGEEGLESPIAAGQAAFWHAGERHQTRTENGLTAIVLEGKEIKRKMRIQEQP